MIKFLSPKDSSKLLYCPYDQSPLRVLKKGFRCPSCARIYSQKNHITQLFDPKTFDPKTRQELKGNFYKLDKTTIETFSMKDQWSSYHQHCSDKKFNSLMNKLNKIPLKGLASLGSGTGFEIKKILQKRKINLILSSDLSYTATYIVPYSLKEFDITLCLFTSDMNNPPVRPDSKIPILIYEAMHHTGDIHKTMDILLGRGYKNIFFVEPCTNFIVRYLAKKGLAQREEYSGGKPDFLDLKILKKLCKKHNYSLNVETVWEFPEDYFRKIFGDSKTYETLFLGLVDLASAIGNFFKIGSMSIGVMEKK